jgi:enoyl-CoA hydratase
MLDEFSTLALSFSGQVALVSLNRPDKANAMNLEMWGELRRCFLWLDSCPEVRVVVLAGNGKHFCSGLDLAVFTDLVDETLEPARKAEQLRTLIKQLQDDLTAIERCRKPVLAAVHSGCLGGGVDLLCCCDMRYASLDAYFSIKEIDIGMTADVGTLQRLPKLIGDGMVRELSYTGRNFSAEEALQSGFVNRLFDNHRALIDGVMQVAQEIASKSPLAIRGCKEMLLYSRDHSVADGLNYVATWNAGMLSVEDVMRSIQAQIENKFADYKD